MQKANESSWPDGKRYWQAAAGILACLLLILAAYTFFWQTPEYSAKSFRSEYPYIDLARNFVPQEHFIIDIDPLRAQLNEIVSEEDEYEISLYFEFLNTGANAQINQSAEVWPASLLKVPAAIAVMRQVEKGEWKMESELVLTNGDRDDGYGDLWQEPIGMRFTVEVLLNEMLTNSDNTAYNMFLRNMPKEVLIDVLTELGIEDLFNEKGQIGAKEYSRLLRALYTASFLSREHSQQLLDILVQPSYEEFLQQGIPHEVPFAHKFGVREEVHAYLDAGIVYVPERPYLLTVAIRGSGQDDEIKDVQRIMEDISRAAYEYVSTK